VGLTTPRRKKISFLRKFIRSLGPGQIPWINGHWWILVGKPEGKRQLGRPRRRWVDSIKIYLREIGWDGMDWIDLAQDRDQ
jgi:hypothetical protein